MALLLALLLGGFGAHLAYLGYRGRATAYLFVLSVGLALALLGAQALSGFQVLAPKGAQVIGR